MQMAIDTNELFKKLREKGARARGTVTMYLDRALFSDFQKLCDAKGVSASRVIEEMIRKFFEESDGYTAEHSTERPDLSEPKAEIISALSALDEPELGLALTAIRGILGARKRDPRRTGRKEAKDR